MRSHPRSPIFTLAVTGIVTGLLLGAHTSARAEAALAFADAPRDQVSVEPLHRYRGHHPRDLTVVGLTAAGTLVRFDAARPRNTRTIGSVSGLAGDSALIGIDFRPATGALYAVGNAGGIYTLDTTTAVATFRAQMDVLPTGASFGLDFNPTVDRLRIVSDSGQNLRANVDTGATLVDAPLSALGIAGAAYTNNDADPNTATTLFDIDATLDQVAIQAPPNNGNLNPTGKLTVDAAPAVGFDIYTNPADGSNAAYASLQVAGVSGFYSVDLLSGRATRRGSFRSGIQLVDIAVPLGQSCGDDEDHD